MHFHPRSTGATQAAGLAGLYLLAAVAGAGMALGSGPEPQAGPGVPVELAQQLGELRASTESLRREIAAERHRQAQIRDEIELQEMIAIVDSFGLPEYVPPPISGAEIDPVLKDAIEAAAQYQWDGLRRVRPANG